MVMVRKMESDMEKFEKFLSYYNKYHLSISEISMPCPEHENDCPYFRKKPCTSRRKHPLVDNEFPMYSFDDMCRTCDTIDICNLPSTVDALYFDKEKKELYFIEFKGIKIDDSTKKSTFNEILCKMSNNNMKKKMDKKNPLDSLLADFDPQYAEQGNQKNCYDEYYEDLKNIYNAFGDEIAFKLRLKPFESLNLALPNVYEDYCDKEDIKNDDRLNISKFLYEDSIKKYYYVVGVSENPNDSAAHLETYCNILKKPYLRLKELGLFYDADVLNKNQFLALVNDFKT